MNTKNVHVIREPTITKIVMLFSILMCILLYKPITAEATSADCDKGYGIPSPSTMVDLATGKGAYWSSGGSWQSWIDFYKSMGYTYTGYSDCYMLYGANSSGHQTNEYVHGYWMDLTKNGQTYWAILRNDFGDTNTYYSRYNGWHCVNETLNGVNEYTWYYTNGIGIVYTNTWLHTRTHDPHPNKSDIHGYFCFNASGRMSVGWHKGTDGKWYYFRIDTVRGEDGANGLYSEGLYLFEGLDVATNVYRRNTNGTFDYVGTDVTRIDAGSNSNQIEPFRSKKISSNTKYVNDQIYNTNALYINTNVAGTYTADQNVLLVNDDYQHIRVNEYTYYIDRKKFTLTQNINSDTETTKTSTIYYEGTQNIPTPTKTGYKFDGWEVSGNGSKMDGNTFTMGDADATITAKWTPIDYTIKCNTGGGQIASYPTSYNINTDTITIPQPTKSGYAFAGWTGSNGNTAQKTVTIPKGSTGDKTYDAHWTPINYTISYDLQGGTMSGQKTSYNIETPTFSIPTPTKNGYTFLGWTGSNGNTNQLDVSIAHGSTGNKAYTAHWKINTYTMTVNHYKYNQHTNKWDFIKKITDKANYGTVYIPKYDTPTGYYNHHRDWDKGWTVTGNGTFNVYYYPNSYSFNVNTWLDGVKNGNGYSDILFNVYINDKLVNSKVQDYCSKHLYGDTYKVEMISNSKYTYEKSVYTGTISGNTVVEPKAQTVPVVERLICGQSGNDNFYVYAYVSGLGSLNRVVFPSWTDEAGQDDLNPNWQTGEKADEKGNWTFNGQSYNYRKLIKSADHKRTGKDEHNWYNIHVYAYNGYGGKTIKTTTFAFKYNVAFNYNKPLNATSTINNASETVRKVTYNTAYGTLPNPTLKGWTFNGWYTSKDGGIKVTASTIYNITASNQILYAHWSANIYEIKLDSKLEGCTGSTGTTVIYEKYDTGFYSDKACTKQITSITIPHKIGNAFNGYTDDRNVIIDSNGVIKVKTNYFLQNTTLSAKWTLNTYRVIFNGNRNSSGKTDTLVYTWSNSDTNNKALTPNGYIRTGWNYINWNTINNGKDTAYNNNQMIGNKFFIDNLGKDVLLDGKSHDVTLYAQWKDITVPDIKEVTAEQETLLSKVNSGQLTLTSQSGAYNGELYTNLKIKIDENNTNKDASGIKNVSVLVYDKNNTTVQKTYDITNNISYGTNTKYDFGYDGKYYPYSGTYTFKVNLYKEFPNASKLGIYVYCTDAQGNTTKRNDIFTRPSVDIPQDKPIVIPDKPIEGIVIDEINECIYSQYVTVEGSKDFGVGETGITTTWTYGYVERYDLDYREINTEMENEIANNLLSADNRMNRSHEIGRDNNGKAPLASVDNQIVRIPPYVLQHLSTPDTTKHDDGTTKYKDLLNNKYTATGYKGTQETGIYNIYNIKDTEYQAVHYRSGV